MERAMDYDNMGSKFILTGQLHEAAIINFEDGIFGKLEVQTCQLYRRYYVQVTHRSLLTAHRGPY